MGKHEPGGAGLKGRSPPRFSVLQDPLRGIIQIFELAPFHRDDEEDGEEGAQGHSDGEKEEDRVHHSPRSTARSTREAPQMTIPLERGMRIAATRGFTHPAAATETAPIL